MTGHSGRTRACLVAGLLASAMVAPTAWAEAPQTPAPAAAATIAPAAPGTAHPSIWPAYDYPVPTRAEHEARIAALMARMTIEEKVGQLVQADLCCVTPDDFRTYKLGSLLVGGNSGPTGNDLSPAPDWLKAADDFYLASVDKSDGGVGIPMIWGIDAVHGHSNIIGATIFPHNIGLGAMRDPALIERIGAITAKEIRVTGQEWTFAPTVAVPQDFRWGRAYEGYSSDPKIVASYVGAMVRGLQGPPTGDNLLAGPYVIASTKHFLADGGTDNGVDQGDSSVSEEALRDIHGKPYGPAIAEGVATVMVSFSSWQGVKMTGNRSLITGVLKEQMDFGGFVVSDWNAHGQVAGCTNDACPQALSRGDGRLRAVAQLVESRSPKPVVGGSSPSGPARRSTAREVARDLPLTARRQEGHVSSEARGDAKLSLFGRLALFLRQVVAELRKVIWPTRKELVTYTIVVIVFVAVMAAIVAVYDYVFTRGVLFIFG